MTKLIAEFISYLFHPVIFFLLMPFLIVYRKTEDSLYALKWFSFSFLFIAIGIIVVMIGKKRGIFSDYDITQGRQRYEFFLQLLFFGFVYISIAILFKGIFFPISLISIGIGCGIVLFALVNPYIKASIHLAVSCAFVLTIGVYFGWQFFLGTVFIIPALFWSRSILKKHTHLEMVIGAILGIVITLVTLLLGKYLYGT